MDLKVDLFRYISFSICGNLTFFTTGEFTSLTHRLVLLQFNSKIEVRRPQGYVRFRLENPQSLSKELRLFKHRPQQSCPR